ncbi:hypothetical protein RRG08_045404 [Elysia crispata]|uniref:Uncharacterized protein n=1 Tax=Elysia crispata TaxID=231223 RepID=A0AAE1D066_9GAST|nr:hypothetical protein RRG08_045404 [Elysia crispata]
MTNLLKRNALTRQYEVKTILLSDCLLTSHDASGVLKPLEQRGGLKTGQTEVAIESNKRMESKRKMRRRPVPECKEVHTNNYKQKATDHVEPLEIVSVKTCRVELLDGGKKPCSDGPTLYWYHTLGAATTIFKSKEITR